MTEQIVAKFGGTSNRDAQAVQLCAQQAVDYRILVTSAPGKLAPDIPLEFDYPDKVPEPLLREKVTDQLLKAHTVYRHLGEVSDLFTQSIRARYQGIVQGLGIRALQDEWLRDIPARVQTAVHQGEDHASMLGERLQAEVYQAMGWKVLDPARSGIDLSGRHAKDAWRSWLQDEVSPNGSYVLPGNTYYDGRRLRTFSRGGSDISGAYAAYGLRADRYMNMTDTPGQSADPRLIQAHRLRPIEHLTYLEGRELGRNGTGLLHPQAIVPLMYSGIETHIGSTFDHEGFYTIYSDDVNDEGRAGQVQAISLIPNVAVISVHEPGMSGEGGRVVALGSPLAEAGINTVGVEGYGSDIERFIVGGEDQKQAARLLKEASEFDARIKATACSLVTLVGYDLIDSALDIRLLLRDEIGLGDNDVIPGVRCLEAKHSLRFMVPQDQAERVVDQAHALLIEPQP